MVSSLLVPPRAHLVHYHSYSITASISPDGRTLLCAGDAPYAYLYRIIPGTSLSFELLAKYMIPMPPQTGPFTVPEEVLTETSPTQATTTAMQIQPLTVTTTRSTSPHAIQSPAQTHQTFSSPTSTHTPTPKFTPITTHVYPPARPLIAPCACFTTAWTADGRKFAVAAQEGVLVVWDVRSSAPVWVFWTGVRGAGARSMNDSESVGGQAIGNTNDSDSSWGVGGGEGWPRPFRGGWAASSRVPITVSGGAGTDAGGSTVPSSAPSLISRLRPVPLPVTLPFHLNSGSDAGEGGRSTTGTYNTNSTLDTAGFGPRLGDPGRRGVGVVRTLHRPMEAYMDSEMGPFGANGPVSGIRNVRFSAGEGGRELCVFVEVGLTLLS